MPRMNTLHQKMKRSQKNEYSFKYVEIVDNFGGQSQNWPNFGVISIHCRVFSLKSILGGLLNFKCSFGYAFFG